MKETFLTLKQRNLIVAEYEQLFSKYYRHAKAMFPTEDDRCKRFEKGLNDRIRMMLYAQKIRVFSALVEATKSIEKIQGNQQQRWNKGQQKRPPGKSSSAPMSSKK